MLVPWREQESSRTSSLMRPRLRARPLGGTLKGCVNGPRPRRGQRAGGSLGSQRVDVGLDRRIARGQLTLIRVEQLEVLLQHEDVLGPPTLVVEILSPATTLIDRSTKRLLYARHGVPYYWIVDPEARTVEAYTLSEGGYQLAARVAGSQAVSPPPFPDLAFAPSSLWP